VLFSLLGATGVLFLGSMAIGGLFTTLFVLSIMLTGAYVVMLANAQKRVLERRTKVRHLPTPSRAAMVPVDYFAEDRSAEVDFDDVPHIRAVGSR
jgi:hypothetical protein